ncbi:MAG TPA: P1 family peptidase [Fimbriimonadaceae bacterium]|nr:P1 family peptidase [Fimbriimonadaceae bacterium]
MKDGKSRARDVGLFFDGAPGPLNAITDVAGVEVGHTTLIEGKDVRTGVTVIHPRGREGHAPVYAGYFSLNGNGEMTGSAWIEEAGLLAGPVVLTNTHSVGVARDAVVQWLIQTGRPSQWHLPVVAETYDGGLNDINGFHVKPEHVFEALDGASGGAVAEGNVGGGTGMICYGYKGGIGTSSRVIEGSTVGVLVQANHGARSQLRLRGTLKPGPPGEQEPDPARGSIIIIVATDAPMLPHQLRALAKRAALGLGRTGAVASLSSGDIFLAFSTGNALAPSLDQGHQVTALGQTQCTPIYEAAVQATEEAIINALVAAETMTGKDGLTVLGLLDAHGDT